MSNTKKPIGKMSYTNDGDIKRGGITVGSAYVDINDAKLWAASAELLEVLREFVGCAQIGVIPKPDSIIMLAGLAAIKKATI